MVAAGAALLATAGCAANPAPHPVVAEAVPAQSAPPPTPTPADARGEEKAPRGSGTSEHAARQTNRALGWVALSIGAEAAVVAGITSFMMLHYDDQRNSDCSNKVCTPDGLNANTQISQLAGWNAAAYVVAAAGLGAGIFLLVTNPSDKSLGTEVGVSPGGVALRGSF